MAKKIIDSTRQKVREGILKKININSDKLILKDSNSKNTDAKLMDKSITDDKLNSIINEFKNQSNQNELLIRKSSIKSVANSEATGFMFDENDNFEKSMDKMRESKRDKLKIDLYQGL